MFALMHRTHTFPPAVTSKPVAVDTSLTCISWATRPFTCKHNKNGVGSSLRVHLYRSARTYVLTASVVECQSSCTWKLIYSIGTQLTSVNDCQTRRQSSVDQVPTELSIKYWLSVRINWHSTADAMIWSAKTHFASVKPCLWIFVIKLKIWKSETRNRSTQNATEFPPIIPTDLK